MHTSHPCTHTHTNITYTQVHSASFQMRLGKMFLVPGSVWPPWSRSRYYLPGTEKTSLFSPRTQAKQVLSHRWAPESTSPCSQEWRPRQSPEQPAVLQRPSGSLGAPEDPACWATPKSQEQLQGGRVHVSPEEVVRPDPAGHPGRLLESLYEARVLGKLVASKSVRLEHTHSHQAEK